MTAFIKPFLRDDILRSQDPQGRQIFLGAFGKHPGWDDHIKDIPIESTSLMTAWGHFEDGIRSQVDTGAWKGLPSEYGPIEFDHVLLWRREQQFVLGTLWSSRDAIGRREYPMALFLHGVNVPLPWALETLLPRLQELRSLCQTTELEGEVRAMLPSRLQELRLLLAALPGSSSEPNADPDRRSRFLSRFGWPAHEEKLLHLLHQIRIQMSDYAPRARGQAPRTSLNAARAGQGAAQGPPPQQLRVPSHGDEPGVVLFQWADLFAALLDRAAPVLFLRPAAGDWVDVVVGEPSNKSFFALRAGRGALPLATDATDPIDAPNQESGRKFIKDYLEAMDLPLSSERRKPAFTALFLVCGATLLLGGASLRFAPARYLPAGLHTMARWLGNPDISPGR